MKKTTRNYIRLLMGNLLLIAAVGVLWQARVKTEIFTPPATAEAMVEPANPLPASRYLKDLKTPANLSDLKGQWTLLNLWATWCGPCIIEMPSLQTLNEEYKNKGLQVIAISVDEMNGPEELGSRIDSLNLGPIARNWDSMRDISNMLSPTSLPVTYLVDPAGNIRATRDGAFDWGSPENRAWLEKIMAPKEAPVKI